MVDGPAPDRERALELAQAGANEAALAIARLLKMSSARVAPLETVADAALAQRHGPRALVVSFTVTGAVQGRFAVVTSEAHARALAKELVPSLKGDGLPKKAVGALMELGNIGASAYLNGIADMLNASCWPSVPHLVVDESHAAVSNALGAGASSVIVARVTAGPHDIDLALSIT
jgi:chemotaxis protein CheY-P-specific phosphatase CheC